MQPITDNLRLVNASHVDAYLQMLFGYVEWEADQAVHLRGVGEKGTAQEGVFRESIDVAPNAGAPHAILGSVNRWAQYHSAAFLVPAVTRRVGSGGVKDGDVLAYTTILVDIDAGDTAAKLDWLTRHIGEPSMVVGSGGATAEGKTKYHVYWKLTEPAIDVALIAELRGVVAERCGGDPSFKRLPQIIRIPGSVHAKGGTARAVPILKTSRAEYELSDIEERIRDMPRMPGVEEIKKQRETSFLGPSGGLDFSRLRGDTSRTQDVLTSDVQAGGDGGTTRWDNFNVAAGHFIREARSGAVTIEEAAERAYAWMQAHMQPAWPDERFAQEWRGLLTRDVESHGPLPMPAAATPYIPPQSSAALPFMAAEENIFLPWSANLWVGDEKLKREWLVDGLILKGEPHLLVAEGGAGKTFSMLELGLKIAGFRPERGDTFWGLPLTAECGGTVVIITTEDSKRELAIRIQQIDRAGLRHQVRERFIVYPTVAIENGSFTVCERDARGNVVASQAWRSILAHLKQIPDLRLVVIDTLNAVMHGDENSASVIGEFRREAFGLCTEEMGVAFVLTHHVRKAGNDPIKNRYDMLQAARGSNALPNAFRICIGLWRAHDFGDRMPPMGLKPEPGKLWMADVIKGNNPEVISAPRTLLRTEEGVLVDVTGKDAYRAEIRKRGGEEQLAWIVAAIEHATEARHPYTSTGASGLYQRRGELPPSASGLSREVLESATRRLLDGRRLVLCAIGGARKAWLDTDGGYLARNVDPEHGTEYERAEGAYSPPDWSDFTYNGVLDRIVRKNDNQ